MKFKTRKEAINNAALFSFSVPFTLPYGLRRGDEWDKFRIACVWTGSSRVQCSVSKKKWKKREKSESPYWQIIDLLYFKPEKHLNSADLHADGDCRVCIRPPVHMVNKRALSGAIIQSLLDQFIGMRKFFWAYDIVWGHYYNVLQPLSCEQPIITYFSWDTQQRSYASSFNSNLVSKHVSFSIITSFDHKEMQDFRIYLYLV